MTMSTSTLAVLFPLLLLLVGLTFTVVIDPYIRREHRRIMLIIVVLCLTLIGQNIWDYSLTVGPPRPMLRTIVSIYGYAIRPVILILFLYIVGPAGKRRYWWILAGLNGAVYLSALFSPVSFWIDQGNHYRAGPLAPACLVASMILLLGLLIKTFRRRKPALERRLPMHKTWKKLLSLGLALMLVLGCLPLSALAAERDTLPYQYTSNENNNIQESDDFQWRNCFARSSFLGCDHLRLLSAQVAITSASYYGADLDPYEQDVSDLGHNVRNMLASMGFEDVVTNAYYRAETREDSAAVAVGHRTVQAEGETFTLLAIIPRSAGYKQEWSGNFHVGESGLHAGFQAARDEILRFVKSYLAEYRITGKLKLWITGHSRGAAVSNLLGGFFAGGGMAYFGDSVSAGPEDVYCYTFATPRTVLAGVEKNAELSVSGNRGGEYALDTVQAPFEYTGGGALDPEDPVYGGIRNYPLAYDFITYLPPQEWGFTYYGSVCSMTETMAGESISPEAMLAELDAVSHFVFREWIGGEDYPGDYENYPGDYRAFREMDFDLGTLSLVPVEGGASGEEGMNDFIRAFVSGIPALIPTRDDYVTAGYEEMMTALAGLYGMVVIQFSDVLLENAEDLILPGVLCYLAYAYDCLHGVDETVTEADATTIALVELLDYVGGTRHDRAEIENMTTDDLVEQVFRVLEPEAMKYLEDPESAPLMQEVMPLLSDLIPADYMIYVRSLLELAVPVPEDLPEGETYTPTMEELLAYYLLACTEGPAVGSFWSEQEDYDTPEECRGFLYSVMALLPLLGVELPEGLADAFSENGTQPATGLITAILPLLTGTDEAGTPLSLADAADAGLRSGLSAMIEGVLASIEAQNLAYSADFTDDIRRHAATLLDTPSGITLLRNAIVSLLIRTDGGFDTQKTVRKIATFVGTIGRIPQAHYNEVFIAWAKAAVRQLESAEVTPVVTIVGWVAGETPSAPRVTGNPGGGAVRYTYAPKGSTEFSAAVPTEPGEYTVKATVEATHDYAGGEATMDFVILRAETAQTATFSVTVAETAHGTVTVSNGTSAWGEEVTFTAVPEEGFEVESVSARELGGAELPLTDKGNGVWSFTQPTFPVTVRVTFAKVITTRFEDVEEGSYYYAPVYWALRHEVTDGTSPTTFGPEETATRSQMVTFVWRAVGCPEPTVTQSPFIDLDENEYYYKAVLWAWETGLTDGTSDTTFEPELTVTRGQAITFLYRALVEPLQAGGEETSAPETNGRSVWGTLPVSEQQAAPQAPFADLDGTEYYYSAVVWAWESGITDGLCSTDFRPEDPCLRQDIVTFLYRVYAD